MNNKNKLEKASLKNLDSLLGMGYKLYLVEKEFESLMIFEKNEARKRYISELKNANALFLILYVEEKVAGYCYAHLEKPKYLETQQTKCELEVVYLEPAFRKQGLSSLFIDEVIKWAKNKNAFRITTDIFSANKASIGAFEKHNFIPNTTSYTLDIN
jgi:RimJ/RimL family protein N-acetyltransferase